MMPSKKPIQANIIFLKLCLDLDISYARCLLTHFDIKLWSIFL